MDQPLYRWHRSAKYPRAIRGFTLIELMIVVAIVAILAAVAYPSYASYIKKGKRAEGRAALIALMQQQERFLTQTGAYEQPLATLKAFSGDSLAQSAYTLSSALCADPANKRECIVLTAIPNGWSDPEVQTLRITSAGLAKDCTGTPAPTKPDLCWK